MNAKDAKQVVLAVIVVAAVVAAIFWTMVFVDGEDMFVFGAVISSAVLSLALNSLLAREYYDVAVAKGYTDQKYFWYSFLFGMLGFLLVIALPDRNSQK